MATLATMISGLASDVIMKFMSAKDAKNGFGLLLDTARAEPVAIEKHGRAVVVVVSVEEYRRLKATAFKGDKLKRVTRLTVR